MFKKSVVQSNKPPKQDDKANAAETVSAAEKHETPTQKAPEPAREAKTA